MVTHQRLAYTQKALAALLESDYPSLEIVVWDNASTDGTREWVSSRFGNHKRITLILSHENVGLAHAMNVVWGTSRSPLLAKVDNDTLVPPHMLSRLAELHRSSEELGVLSGCHFDSADIQSAINAHVEAKEDHRSNAEASILRQSHVGGCAVMMRRAVFAKHGMLACRGVSSDGPFLESAWTDYQEQLHRLGYVNGYPLPLIHVDHMEDTRSPNHIASSEHESYKLAMRGQSLGECTMRMYVEGAAKLASTSKVVCIDRQSSQTIRTPRRLRGEHLTLFVPLSGRQQFWPRMARYLNDQTWSRQRINLMLVDTSQDAGFHHQLTDWMATCSYPDLRLVKYAVGSTGLADKPRRDATPDVRKAMAAIYDMMQTRLETEYVWILEDDILPPTDVATRLMSAFDRKVGAVGAPYRSRYGDRYVAWDESGKNYVHPQDGVRYVGGNGFGCTIIRTNLLSGIRFDPTQDCDRQFYKHLLSQKALARIDWSCECVHGTD